MKLTNSLEQCLQEWRFYRESKIIRFAMLLLSFGVVLNLEFFIDILLNLFGI